MIRRINRTKAGALSLAIAGLLEPACAGQTIVRPANFGSANKVAERSVHRIDEAALHACGASGSSLTEVKAATRTGPCWREAAGHVVEQSGDPVLAQAFARFASTSR
jgi:hypothetical protein